jgi:hypothetical protein
MEIAIKAESEMFVLYSESERTNIGINQDQHQREPLARH